MMKTCSFLIPVSALALSSCINAETRNPNVIIILADDLGYGDLGAQGASTIKTPCIDRIASEGVRFTNGYATSATSTPSRYALMTGMYPWKNKQAKILPGDAPLIIAQSAYTLPKMMKDAGYVTGAIGKWHLGMGDGNVDWNKTVSPGAREVGFDYSVLIAATNDRVPTVFVENGDVVGLDPDDPVQVSYKKNFPGEPTALTNPEMLKLRWSHGHNQSVHNGIPRIGFQKGGKSALWVDEDMADYFTGKVKNFLTENKDKPFFLYFGLHQPHVPRTPNGRFVGKSGMGSRGDAILEADWCVGEVMKKLEDLGLLENTIVIFSSDNGPVLDDGYDDQAEELLGDHKPAGPLRGGKYSLYDAGARVPFLVYWKGQVKPAVSDAMVCQMDLFASLAKLIHHPLEKKLDSENILPAFLGKSKKGRTELVTEANGKLAYHAGEWVFIPAYKGEVRNITGNELGNLPEDGLFNLAADIGQQENVASGNKSRIEKMKSRFLELTRGYYTADVKEIPLR